MKPPTAASMALASGRLLLGPAYEVPSNVTKKAIFKSAASNITENLHSVLATGKTPFGGDIDGDNNAVSVTVTFGNEALPIFDYHHTPKNLNVSAGSVESVSHTSMYRVGSISKLITWYTLLLNNGTDIYNRPVTDFVSELKGDPEDNNSAVDMVQWDQVTVGALASYLAGIGRDYGNADYTLLGIPAAEVGLPDLPPEKIPVCGLTQQTHVSCTRKQFFDGFLKRRPVFLPYTTPVYSNAAFRILGYVLENITGTSFHDAYKHSTFRPLEMHNTSSSTPKEAGVGVIAPGISGWDTDIGDEVPTGGIYSSSGDLAKFGQAIIQNKQLSALETRRWMKPRAHTSSMSFSVGDAWEIWRTRSNITSGRVVDLYTKSGSSGQYETLLILVPELQLTIATLAAGADSVSLQQTASELVVQQLLPAMEEVARKQACDTFCGIYNSTDAAVNSTMEIALDEEPGLLVKSWINRGVDFYNAAQGFADSTDGGQVTSVRLYPSNARNETEASYRALFMTRPQGRDETIARVFDSAGEHWGKVDQLMYGSIAVDDFIFHVDKDGAPKSVEARVMRAGVLDKV